MDETLNNVPCGFFAFSHEGRILDVNDTLLKLLGFARNELEGLNVESILTISSRIFYQTHFFPLLALHGKADEIFITLQAKNRESLPMLAFAVRREARNECIVVPIQQRQKYEQEILDAKRAAEEAMRSNLELLNAKKEAQTHAQELDRKMSKVEQRNRELLQVTNILFHDMKEPIRKITTFANLLSEEHCLNEEARFSLSKISSACHRMTQLLKALQQFVTVEDQDEGPAPVDLNRTIAEAHSEAKGRNPYLVHDLHVEKLPEIEGYPRQLHQMFVQLFDNAFNFRRKDTPLVIRITGGIIQLNSFQAIKGRYRYIDFVQILFRDNGIGIADEYREAVFELLKRLNIESQQPGCGLAICKKVAENHYGSITLGWSSGQGTTFKVLLPVKQEQFKFP